MSYHGSIIAFRKLREIIIANSAIHSLCVMELRRPVQRPRQASGEIFTQNHTHGTILGEELLYQSGCSVYYNVYSLN